MAVDIPASAPGGQAEIWKDYAMNIAVPLLVLVLIVIVMAIGGLR